MTTTDRRHLTYPSYARLQERLAQAEDQRLAIFDVVETRAGPMSVDWSASCTPSTEGDEPYYIWLQWDLLENRVYAHCTCTAGYYGTGCKHSALLGDLAGALNEDTEWRILDHEDMESYRTTLDLPAWDKDKEAGDEQHE